MKIGDRVCFKRQARPLTKWCPPRGTVVSLGGGFVTVRWDTGPTIRHDADVLVLAESFPYRSHRTMAQVIQDEQKPVPA